MDDGIQLIPKVVRDLYEVMEWRHASAILHGDFPTEWDDVMSALGDFRLLESDIRAPGGGKSRIAQKLDTRFEELGWREVGFRTAATVEDKVVETRTHKVDRFKNRIALEVEWNNKDPFYDRDLDNFRHLFNLNIISVGIIVTRSDELQRIFDDLGKGKSYGPTTTHLSRLVPRIERGGGGGCPLLVFGITHKLYVAGQ
jgi:hypothetical protein